MMRTRLPALVCGLIACLTPVGGALAQTAPQDCAVELAGGAKRGDLEGAYTLGGTTPKLEEGQSWLVLGVKLNCPTPSRAVILEEVKVVDKAGTTYSLRALDYARRSADSAAFRFLEPLEEPPDAVAKKDEGFRPAGGWTPMFNKDDGRLAAEVYIEQAWIDPNADPKKIGPFAVPVFHGGNREKIGNFRFAASGRNPLKRATMQLKKDPETGRHQLNILKSPINLMLLFAVPTGAEGLSLKVNEQAAFPVTLVEVE